jgi:hypothetical protein
LQYAALVGESRDETTIPLQFAGSFPAQQGGWRLCKQCQGLFYAGGSTKGGICVGPLVKTRDKLLRPAHDGSESLRYAFMYGADAGGFAGRQTGWRACKKCQGMFSSDDPSQGACPAGGAHDGSGSVEYVAMVGDRIPHDGGASLHYAWENYFSSPNELRFDDDSIVFETGVGVGGFAHLVLRSDGTYQFSGHFHDSGATEYNVGLVWGVKDVNSGAYTFQHSGHVAGTFEAGSRDDDWSVDGQNDAIKENWDYLVAGATSHVQASAKLDLINLTNSVVGVLGGALSVVGIVVA